MTDHRHPADSPGLLLWRATLQWQRRIVAALKPVGLTHVQFVLLASVWWLTQVAGEEPNQRRVAEHAGTDPMMISQVLRVLTSKGLIARETDPSDLRAWRVGITEQGVALATRAVKIVEAADAELFQTVGNQAALQDVLRTLGG